jgi:hypothetical protein
VKKILVLVAIGVVGGCSSHAPNASRAVDNVPPTPLQEALAANDLHAMADGSAYLVSPSRLCYFSGGKVSPVIGLQTSSSALLTLTPLADGSALAIDVSGKRPAAYWLRGASATPIEEGSDAHPTRSTLQIHRDGFFFVQLQDQLATNESKDDTSDDDREEEEPVYDNE